MKQRIESYVNEAFRNAPKTPQAEEVKSEILGNTLEKFDELKAEGKDDETAFRAAVSSIGNVTELISEYSKDEDAVRIAEAEEKHRSRQAVLLSLSVALYILCVVPVLVFENNTGVILMFVMIAAATALIVYRASTSKITHPGKMGTKDSLIHTDEQKKQIRTRKSLMGAFWSLVVSVYLIISFITMAWHITWIIFLIGGAVSNLIDAVFDYKGWADPDDNESD